MDWQSQIQAEFNKAELARGRGNEGQARVCARRAAGIAAREYFSRQGQHMGTPSAYDILNLLTEDQSVSEDVRQAAKFLTMRVDEEFKLPLDVDLVAAARKLCADLMMDKNDPGS